MAWSMSAPSTVKGWGDYLFLVGIPVLFMISLYPRVYAIADSIYDGTNGNNGNNGGA